MIEILLNRSGFTLRTDLLLLVAPAHPRDVSEGSSTGSPCSALGLHGVAFLLVALYTPHLVSCPGPACRCCQQTLLPLTTKCFFVSKSFPFAKARAPGGQWLPPSCNDLPWSITPCGLGDTLGHLASGHLHCLACTEFTVIEIMPVGGHAPGSV